MHILQASAHSSRLTGRFEAISGCFNHDIFAGGADQTLKNNDSIKRLNSFKILIGRELISDSKKHSYM